LYSHYYETEDFDDMTDESYMTDIDIICKEHEDILITKEREWSEALAAQDREHNKILAAQNREHNKVLAAKNQEIAQLKEQLARLQTQ
ncbi:MAG: hypothetical protein NC347_14040, partial [Clostridium sp.]|nr:hypothetical protein [Clostridium sp.]